jgi:hypothetical protein
MLEVEKVKLCQDKYQVVILIIMMKNLIIIIKITIIQPKNKLIFSNHSYFSNPYHLYHLNNLNN